MRVLVQWTDQDPRDWDEIQSQAWPRISSARPVHAVNVQGVTFEGFDYYAVEDLPGGAVAVSVWNDDDASPDPWMRWTIHPCAPDPEFGGAMNTRQTVEYFHENLPGAKPRSAMRKPVARKAGKWVSDELHARHQQVRSLRGWEEWI